MEYPVKDSATLPRSWLCGILSLDLVSRVIVAARPLKHLDSFLLPDDTYYSLSLAREIASGFAPVYGVDPTNGFQPLYVFLMAPVFLFTGENLAAPVHAALILLSLFDVMALYFLLKLVAGLSRSRATPLLAAALWIFNPYVLRTTMNGLETMMAFALLLASLHAYYILRAREGARSDPRRSLLLGALLGLMILARIDHAVFAASIVGFHALSGAQPRVRRARLAETGFIVLAILAVNLPWFAYSLYYTGDLYPISGRAVRLAGLARVGFRPTFENTYGPNFRTALAHIWSSNAALLVFLGAMSAGASAVLGREALSGAVRLLRFHSVLWVSGVVFVLAYVFYILAPHFYHRYMFALVVIFLLGACSAFEIIHSTFAAPRARRAFSIASIALASLALAVQPRLRNFPRLADFYFAIPEGHGYMELGQWAADYFDPGTIVGSTQSGALGYFAPELLVYNLDGVVNKAAYEAMANRLMMSYVKAQGIEYVILWGSNVRGFMRQSSRFKAGDLISMGKLDGVETLGYEWFVYRINYEN